MRPSLTVHGVPTLEPIETPEAPALPEASEPADPMMAVMSALAALAPGIAVAAQGAPDSTTTAALPIGDDAIAKLLQPMLRQWLDDNMPRIVEKALRNGLDGGAKTE